MTSFTEGESCYLMDYTVDYRDMATVVVLKGGKDASGNDLVATVQDNIAIKAHGKKTKIFSEPQWTTSLLCQLRALQLLANYCEPLTTVVLDAESQLINVGDTVTFTSSTLGVEGSFLVESVSYEYGVSVEVMHLQLSNRIATIADIITALSRAIEKR